MNLLTVYRLVPPNPRGAKASSDGRSCTRESNWGREARAPRHTVINVEQKNFSAERAREARALLEAILGETR